MNTPPTIGTDNEMYQAIIDAAKGKGLIARIRWEWAALRWLPYVLKAKVREVFNVR